MTIITQIEFPDIDVVACRKVETDVAKLGKDEARVSLAYLGICGSDLHVLAGHHPFAKPPIVTGHEISGVVTEIGPGVTSVKVGDHVVADPIMACMNCAACRSGRFNLCEPPRVAGFRAPGFGRSSLVVPARNLHVASPALPLSVLAFAEPAACACHCVGRLPIAACEDVLVIGAGTIGQSIVQALRIIGAGNVTVIEPDAGKRSLALSSGAHRAVAPGGLADDERFTGVIDVVAAQATITESCTRVMAGGTVVCMGVPTGPREVPLPSMQRFERDLLSSGMYVPSNFDEAIHWLEDGRFDTSKLITDIFSADRAVEAYDRARAPSSIKMLLAFEQ